MNKVFEVKMTWSFEGDFECDTFLFDTFEKAKEKFDKLCLDEETCSWIADLDEADKNRIDHEEYYYHAYDSDNYYETTIYIEEKEIN